MSVTMTGNLINVLPGGPRFCVASNHVDYFFLGDDSRQGFFLEGIIAGPPAEFVFNGKLFIPGIDSPGTIIDGFPKSPAPNGWERAQKPAASGYDLVMIEDRSVTLFGFEARGNACYVTANIYDENGQVVAQAEADTLTVERGPALIGTCGIHIN